jgi:hypothetical protein
VGERKTPVMLMKKLGTAWGLAALLVAGGVAAQAGAVTFDLSGGPMTNVFGPPSVPPGSFFTGTLTYDETVSPVAVGLNFKNYLDPTGTITILDGGQLFVGTGVFLSLADIVGAGSLTAFSTNIAGSPPLTEISLFFQSKAGVIYGPGFLPPTSINFADLDFATIFLVASTPAPDNFLISSMMGPITAVASRLSPVPGPETFVLLGAGLAGLAGVAWRRCHRTR